MRGNGIAVALKAACMTSRTLRIAVGLMLAVSVASGLIAWRSQGAYAANDDAAATKRTAYSQSISEHYNLRFGADKPFLPSNATTDTGEFIDPKSFPTAKY